VKRILGTDRILNVLLVGAGNLGRALMAYRGFESKGFRLVAAFDMDVAKVGRKAGLCVVGKMSDLPETIRQHGVQLAILAVPGDAAQAIADQLVAAGIRGILNFAPVSLTVPPEVALTAVDLAVQLEQLSFQVNFAQARVSPAAENSASEPAASARPPESPRP
jgi:redox-sensing transcriptional repressor